MAAVPSTSGLVLWHASPRTMQRVRRSGSCRLQEAKQMSKGKAYGQVVMQQSQVSLQPGRPAALAMRHRASMMKMKHSRRMMLWAAPRVPQRTQITARASSRATAH